MWAAAKGLQADTVSQSRCLPARARWLHTWHACQTFMRNDDRSPGKLSMAYSQHKSPLPHSSWLCKLLILFQISTEIFWIEEVGTHCNRHQHHAFDKL